MTRHLDRFRPHSLRSRIVVSTALVSSIAMIAAIGTMIVVVLSLTAGRVEAGVNDRFDAGVATVVHGEDGSISLLETSADSIEDSVWVFDLAGNQVAGPTAGTRVHATVMSLSDAMKRTSTHRGEHLFVAGPVEDSRTGKPFAVVVATESYEPYEANQNAVIIGLIILGLAVVGGTAALAAWIVGRTLGPVDAMAVSAEEWSERDLDSRFEPGSTDDEIANLGRTLNLLLDRVAATIRGEQLLTSELAHELRTPLTAIRGEAELGLLAGADPAAHDRLDRIVELVDRLTATISTLVSLARGRSDRGQRSNVAAAVANVVGGTRVPAAIAVSVSVDRSLEVAAPAEMVERALSPLVDNALRFATTSLTFSAVRTGRVIAIGISDDGTGVDGDAEVFGAGLGLALSRRVARTLGGDVRLNSPAKPTTFTLELPSY